MGQLTGKNYTSSLGNAVDQRALIAETVVLNHGNILKTAHDLGIHRSTLYRRLAELGLWPIVNRARREQVVFDDIQRRLER